jgi:AraC-like DNA-binding protein
MYEHRYREPKSHGAPDFPFHVYTVEHPGGVHSILPIHWHNEMEIIYLFKGSATFRVERREYAIQAGEALLIHPGELHSGDGNHDGGVCYCSIVFKLSWLSSLQTDRIQELFLNPLLQGDVRLPTLLSTSCESHLALLDAVRKILLRYDSRSPAYEMSLKGMMLQLIADLHRLGLVEEGCADVDQRGRELHQPIKKVLAYMEDNAGRKITLDQLASILSLSRSHFCKFFRTQTGMRPMEYLNYLRVNHAAKLLRTGSYNILEASLESGFQHVSYFTKWFKFYMNMTPSEYKSRYTSGL